MTLRGKRVVREGQAGGDGLREPGGNGLLGVRRRRAGKWWVASLAVTRMPPPMSTMTVGDDGANEVETHSSSDNISGAATPALATKTMQSLRGGVLKWCVTFKVEGVGPPEVDRGVSSRPRRSRTVHSRWQ